MIEAVPVFTAVTAPVVEPTVTFALRLLHVPPPASVNAVVAPLQTVSVPVIPEGELVTVIVLVAMAVAGQELALVYVVVTVFTPVVSQVTVAE